MVEAHESPIREERPDIFIREQYVSDSDAYGIFAFLSGFFAFLFFFIGYSATKEGVGFIAYVIYGISAVFAIGCLLCSLGALFSDRSTS